jgi:pathogenesis-related protein 1
MSALISPSRFVPLACLAMVAALGSGCVNQHQPSRIITNTSPSTRPSSASPSADPRADPSNPFVTAHNTYRDRVSPPAKPPLPPVRWSNELAATAQAWADRCKFEHSQGSAFGENLAARTHMAAPAEIVADWASEAADYDYARDRCAPGKVCGHYTQMVWRSSTQIGCGVAQCSTNSPFGDGDWVMWVCNYSPAGNYTGERPY